MKDEGAAKVVAKKGEQQAVPEESKNAQTGM